MATTDDLEAELLEAGRFGGPTRPDLLDRLPELSGLLRRAGLPVTGEGLVVLLDRGIGRLSDPLMQEVAKATYRRPPYSAELLEDRLHDCARRLAQQRQAARSDDPVRSARSVVPASYKTMRRRREEMAPQLAPLMRREAERLSGVVEGGPMEPRPIPGDRSEFIADRTIPDGTLMRPGESDVKVWEIRNSGTVPWIGRYLIRLGSAHGPVTPERVPIPDTQPGEKVRISVEVEAPPVAGTYEVHWKMADEHGRLFFPDRYWAGVYLTIVVPGPH